MDLLEEQSKLVEEFLNKTVSNAPQGWESITVNLDFSPDSSRGSFTCIVNGNTKSFPGPTGGYLLKLRELYSSEKGDIKKMVINISQDRKFNIDFSY